MNKELARDEESVEQSIAEMVKQQAHNTQLPAAKSFAPPAQRGIHELISEVREDVSASLRKLEIIEQRMVEFDNAQRAFYNGRKP